MSSMLNAFSDLVKTRDGQSDSESATPDQRTTKIETNGLDFYYGDQQALFDISMTIPERPSPPSSDRPVAEKVRSSAPSTG